MSVDRSSRPWLIPPIAAAVLGILAVALMAGFIVTAGLVRQLTALNVGPTCVLILVYAGVGVVVARRQPGNPVGWILLAFILLFMLSADGGYYAVYAFSLGHNGLPLAAAAVLVQPFWTVALGLIPLVILLFPDGRLTSRRWRLVLWAYTGLWACVIAVIWVPTVIAVADHDVQLDSFGDITSGAARVNSTLTALEILVVGVIVLIWLSFIGHQVLSCRRTTGERRQQQKWLAWGAVITIVGFVLGAAFSGGVIGELAGLEIGALPVGIGVGILKYRLRDRPDHQPDLGLRAGHGFSRWTVCGSGLARDARARRRLAGRRGCVHTGGGGPVQSAAAADAAHRGPAVQPGPL